MAPNPRQVRPISANPRKTERFDPEILARLGRADVALPGSFVIALQVPLVPKLEGELEAIREETGVTMEELLAGQPEERRQLHQDRARGKE